MSEVAVKGDVCPLRSNNGKWVISWRWGGESSGQENET